MLYEDNCIVPFKIISLNILRLIFYFLYSLEGEYNLISRPAKIFLLIYIYNGKEKRDYVTKIMKLINKHR